MMLKNVPIDKLIELLQDLQKTSSLVNIEIDEVKPGISFSAVLDSNAIKSKTELRSPRLPDTKLDIDDLNKLIV